MKNADIIALTIGIAALTSLLTDRAEHDPFGSERETGVQEETLHMRFLYRPYDKEMMRRRAKDAAGQ